MDYLAQGDLMMGGNCACNFGHGNFRDGVVQVFLYGIKGERGAFLLFLRNPESGMCLIPEFCRVYEQLSQAISLSDLCTEHHY